MIFGQCIRVCLYSNCVIRHVSMLAHELKHAVHEVKRPGTSLEMECCTYIILHKLVLLRWYPLGNDVIIVIQVEIGQFMFDLKLHKVVHVYQNWITFLNIIRLFDGLHVA